MGKLEAEGWTITPSHLPADILESLRESVFTGTGPGQRCLLNQSLVRRVAIILLNSLVAAKQLPGGAIAIQAIAFDKTPGTNWKVTWHQDLMFPFAAPVTSPGFESSSIKEGIPYARPPREILGNLLAVRLHLDECDATNGPLRLLPGTHQRGILKSAEIQQAAAMNEAVVALTKTGDLLLMKPLLLHASSPATMPKHRRVLHFVYYSGQPIAEHWHRAIHD